MKVYVCTSESTSDGYVVDAVYDSLELAQEKMRVESVGYREQNPRAELDWYSGVAGKWGWWDVDCSEGYYVTEMELNGEVRRG